MAYIRIGRVDGILKDICPEDLVSLVIPVDCRCPSEVRHLERNVNQFWHIQRNTEDFSTTNKKYEGFQGCIILDKSKVLVKWHMAMVVNNR